MVLLAFAGLAAFYAAWSPRSGAPVPVVIPEGAGASQAARILAEAGVLEAPGSLWIFRLEAKLRGLERTLKPGSYELRRGLSSWEALRRLSAGPRGAKTVIPEGFRASQIAERLEALGVCRAKDFLAVAKGRRAEGRLFPTTYFFDSPSQPRTVVEKMMAEFNKEMLPLYAKAAPRPELTLEQALTLASIVEREARRPSERPLIAAVYLNRLRVGMRLEADPTVQYALGFWKKRLSLEDLKVPSPYNTYVHAGLPPGPICSPGTASFDAALHPAVTKSLYFIADQRGGHIFTESHEEHVKIKARLKELSRRAHR